MSNYKRYTFEEASEYNNPTIFTNFGISWYTKTVHKSSGNSRNYLFDSSPFVTYIECEEKEIGSDKFNSNIFKLKAWVILIDNERKVIYGEYKKVTSNDEENYSFNPIISIGELWSGWDSEEIIG